MAEAVRFAVADDRAAALADDHAVRLADDDAVALAGLSPLAAQVLDATQRLALRADRLRSNRLARGLGTGRQLLLTGGGLPRRGAWGLGAGRGLLP